MAYGKLIFQELVRAAHQFKCDEFRWNFALTHKDSPMSISHKPEVPNEDEVLRRMLNTPPKPQNPKAVPVKNAVPAKKEQP